MALALLLIAAAAAAAVGVSVYRQLAAATVAQAVAAAAADFVCCFGCKVAAASVPSSCKGRLHSTVACVWCMWLETCMHICAACVSHAVLVHTGRQGLWADATRAAMDRTYAFVLIHMLAVRQR